MRTPQGDIAKTFLSVALGRPEIMPDYQKNSPDFPFDKSHPRSNLLKADPSKDVSNDNLQDGYSHSVSPHHHTSNPKTDQKPDNGADWGFSDNSQNRPNLKFGNPETDTKPDQSGPSIDPPSDVPNDSPWNYVNPNVGTSYAPRMPISYPKYHKPVRKIHWKRQDTDPRTGMSTRTDVTQTVNPTLVDRAWNALSKRFGW